MTAVLFYVLACVSMVVADYDCACNYNVEEVVHTAPSDVATPIGYMYEFDCKEQIPVASLSTSWLAIAFDHQQGYIHNNGAVQIQKCQGSPPPEDKVTTMASTSTQAATTMTTTTTAKPDATTTTNISTGTPVATTTTTPFTTKITTKAPGQSTTTATPSIITSKLITTHEPTITTSKQITTKPNPTTHQLSTTTPNPSTITIKSITFTPKPTTTTKKPTTVTPTPTTTTTKPTTVTTKPTTTTTKPTTVTPTPTTTTHTPIITTHIPTASTLKPTTLHKQSTLPPTTPKPTVSTIPSSNSPCYNVYRQYASNIKGTLTSYGQSCYQFVTDTLLWSAAEYDCRARGGNLVHIANAQEQNFIYNFLKGHNNHKVWIGLNDHSNEEQFEWISGHPVTYTHWSPNRYSVNHLFQNCVELDPTDSGFWKDKDCDTIDAIHYGYICQYGGSGIVLPQTYAPTTPPARTTHAPVIQTTAAHYAGPDGYTNLCPLNQRQHAQKYGSILAQYGSTCYELMPYQKMTWQHSEMLCNSGGGHLAHITSAAEQTFVQAFMLRHSPEHSAWIGLHDLYYEGQYQWSSGDRVTYTHYLPTHLSNRYNQNYEDCFVIIPYQGGQWDDILCGTTDGYYDYGYIYPPLCQYRIPSSSLPGSLIG